jgi:hypothetical protein
VHRELIWQRKSPQRLHFLSQCKAYQLGGVDEKRHQISVGQRLGCLFVFVESRAGFMLYKPPSYLLPWSVPGEDGRIAGKALQIEQGTVKTLIGNKIDLTLFPSGCRPSLFRVPPTREPSGASALGRGFPGRRNAALAFGSWPEKPGMSSRDGSSLLDQDPLLSAARYPKGVSEIDPLGKDRTLRGWITDGKEFLRGKDDQATARLRQAVRS